MLINCTRVMAAYGDIERKLNISEEQEILVDYQDLASKQRDDKKKYETWFGVNLRNSVKNRKILDKWKYFFTSIFLQYSLKSFLEW